MVKIFKRTEMSFIYHNCNVTIFFIIQERMRYFMVEKHPILQIEKIKGFGELQRAYLHNSRKVEVDNADPTKEHLNQELINQTFMNYNELWKAREIDLRGPGGKLITRRDNVIALEVVTSFSHGAKVQLEAWIQDNINWMKKTFGADNVLSMQLHLDEGTPHIHSIIILITEDGRLCAKDFTYGKKKMSQYQTDYANAMEKYDLKRGIKHSKAKHENIQRFYGELNEAAEAEIPEPEQDENITLYHSRIQKFHQNAKLAWLKVKKELEKEISKLKTELATFLFKYREALSVYDMLEHDYGKEEADRRLQALLTESDSLKYSEPEELSKDNLSKNITKQSTRAIAK